LLNGTSALSRPLLTLNNALEFRNSKFTHTITHIVGSIKSAVVCFLIFISFRAIQSVDVYNVHSKLDFILIEFADQTPTTHVQVLMRGWRYPHKDNDKDNDFLTK